MSQFLPYRFQFRSRWIRWTRTVHMMLWCTVLVACHGPQGGRSAVVVEGASDPVNGVAGATAEQDRRRKIVPKVDFVEIGPVEAAPRPAVDPSRPTTSSKPIVGTDASTEPVAVLRAAEVPTVVVTSRGAEPSVEGVPVAPSSATALIASLRADPDKTMARALDIATLSVLVPRGRLEDPDLAGLGRSMAANVRRYRAVVVALRKTLVEGGGIDAELAGRVLAPSGGEDVPIEIREVMLCRRVKGYGDYDPLVSQRFLAGTKPSFVLYTELDEFTIKSVSDGVNEVRLVQALHLFTETGTTVWSHPAVTIVDTSRNRRRDFFTTQVVQIPPTLGVGRYLLSITITDHHDGSMDEKKVPIEVVATETLARESQ